MKQIQIDHFANFKYLSKLKVSTNGNIGFIVSYADIDENKYMSNFYLYDDGASPLTYQGDVKTYQWWDDDHIVFPALRDQKDKEFAKKEGPLSVFYKLNIHGGEAQEFLRYERAVERLIPLPNGQMLALCEYDHAREQLRSEIEDNEKFKQCLKEEKDYHVLDELPFWANGGGYTNKKRTRLYLIDQDEFKPLTDEFTDVDDLHISEDKTYVLFTCVRYQDVMPMENRLMHLDLDSMNIQDVSIDDAFFHEDFTPLDAESALIIGHYFRDGMNKNPSFISYNFKTGSRRMLYDQGEYSVNGMMNCDIRFGNQGADLLYDRQGVYFQSVINDRAQLMYIHLETGQIEQVKTDVNIIDERILVKDKLYFLGLKDMQGSELHCYTDGQCEPCTDINGSHQQEYMVSPPDSVHFTISDQLDLYGWVIQPMEFDPNRAYPVILNIHGGPKTVYGPNYIHEMQYWAQQGYAVIYCNPRGSDGRGDDFADLRGKYGTIDYDDILTFVDVCLDRFPWMDPARVGVTGGSYGGFMTNWIIGHTHRFKAAVSQRSISNWFTMANTSDIGYFFNQDQMTTTPWDDADKLWWHSPLKYADQVKTPTLFIHSSEDYRCCAVEGIQMFYALKYHRVPSRLCLFDGETHELSRSGKPKHRIRRLKEITDWFDQYLK